MSMSKKKIFITDNLIASFLDGNTDVVETMSVLDAAAEDSELEEYIEFAGQLDRGCQISNSALPITCYAAGEVRDNLCDIRCELYVMRRFNISASEEELVEWASSNKWLRDSGVALHNIGKLCSEKGLSVTRRFNASVNDIKDALDNGLEVLVMVDGGELDGDEEFEKMEDEIVGGLPDHTVAVLAIDDDEGELIIYNPASGEIPVNVPRKRFEDSWEDSKNFMVTITTKEKRIGLYKPEPIDVEDVELSPELLELRDAMAENAHEVWAAGRMAEGWKYGPKRDDELKLHPDLLPYSDLPDSEKEYDRETAMKTIMLLKKLGYDIQK